MSEMGSHDPFGHFKHKLWPKEGPRVKLTIWLLTTKSRKSPQFPCVQVVCNIPLERSQRGYNFASDLISIEGLDSKLWVPKVVIQDFCLKVLGQNAIWVLVLWPGTKYIIKGKVVASPKFGPWWVLWVWICTWFTLTPKALKLYTNQLVVWFVQVRVSDWLLIILPSFIPELQHAPLPAKCYEPGSMPQLLTLPLFSFQTHISVYQGA
jgi:hypothetical protein